jgi:hypothetical protein
MKKPKPDNVSTAFLEHRIRQELAVILRKAYAEGHAQGASPEQVSEILLETLDEFIADQRESRRSLNTVGRGPPAAAEIMLKVAWKCGRASNDVGYE